MTLPQTDLHAVGFFLADHAAVENQKVYANGGFWNRLRFPSFPAVYTFSVVVVLSIPWRANHQDHKFEVAFMDADQAEVSGVFGGEFKVGAHPDAKVGDPTILPVAATINNFTFKAPGDYSAILRVDGHELTRWSFRVSQQIQISPLPRAESPVEPD